MTLACERTKQSRAAALTCRQGQTGTDNMIYLIYVYSVSGSSGSLIFLFIAAVAAEGKKY